MRRRGALGTRHLFVADVPVTALVLAFILVCLLSGGWIRYIIVRLIGVAARCGRLVV
jgi:hypothetical protein